MLDGSLKDKVAIITGASRGLGVAVARRFAKEGANLILVARSLSNLKPIDEELRQIGASPTLVQLDLQDFDHIKDFALSVGAKFPAIDILVANAAILGGLSPVQDYDYNTVKNVMDVNFLANWHLLKYFDPLLKNSSAGRAVFVTSESAASPSLYPYWGPYASSKSALETMVKVYSTETKHSKICVNMVYPITINSGVYTSAFPGQDPIQLMDPDKLTDKFVELCSSKCDVTGQIFPLSENISG